jgi:hypothetical protein
MIRLTGFFAIIPAAILASISYLLLWLNEKTLNARLKALGKAAAVLLLLGALLMLAMGAYIIATGNHPAVMIAKAVCKALPCGGGPK